MSPRKRPPTANVPESPDSSPRRTKRKAAKVPSYRTKKARATLEALRRDIEANDPLWRGTKTVDKLRNAIVAAQRELNAKLKEFFDGKRAATEFGARQARELAKNLTLAMRQIEALSDVAKADKKSLAMEAASGARADMLRQIDIVRGETVFSLGTTPINLQAAERVAKAGQLFSRFPASAETYSKWFVGQIQNELTLASVKNLTFHQASEQLYARIPGAFAQGQYWAERLVRTEMMDAYGAAHETYYQQLTKQEPGWLQRWDAARDNRTCPICSSLHNQIVDKANGGVFIAEWTATSKGKKGGKGGGRSQRRSLRTDRAPAHPNCRCSVWPWREEFAKYIDLKKE